MKKCIKCHKECEDAFDWCPICGGELTEASSNEKGGNFAFDLNLGDANAISGGITASSTTNTDSHNVTNVDSHNVTNNYVNQYERPKTSQEIHQENTKEFRSYFKEICSLGVITGDKEIWQLKKKAIELGIDWTDAEECIRMEQECLRHACQSLKDEDWTTISYLEGLISCNNLEEIRKIYPLLEAMNNRTSDDVVKYYFYAVEASIFPEKLIMTLSQGRTLGISFWELFWKAQALRKRHRDGEYLACFSRLETLAAAENDYSKKLLTNCISNIFKSKTIPFFKDNAIAKYQELTTQDNAPYSNDLITAIGYILGINNDIDRCRFYVRLIEDAEEKFVLPKMIKIDLI